jgi:hypothetical protein
MPISSITESFMKNIHIFRTRLLPKVTPCEVADCGSRLLPFPPWLYRGRQDNKTPVKRCRKGLFHIIEIVIITLVMFVMIFQISLMPENKTDWGKSRLTVQGRDVLHSIRESGIEWSDEDGILGLIDDAFGGTRVRSRLELSGVPRESVSVGCLCQDAYKPGCEDFCGRLSGTLPRPGDLSFNGMGTGFTVSETESISNIFDVMVSSQPLTGLDTAFVNYISADKGFIIVRDLLYQDFADYGAMLKHYFAVDYSETSGSGAVTFELDGLSGNPEYYRIPKYFSHIPNGTGDYYEMAHEFDAFSTDRFEKMPDPQGETVLKTANGHPACVAMQGVSMGLGRTAWLSGDSSSPDDWGILLESLILWSSKHARTIKDDEMGAEKAISSIYVVPDDTSLPDYMFQPMEAVLTLGYLY